MNEEDINIRPKQYYLPRSRRLLLLFVVFIIMIMILFFVTRVGTPVSVSGKIQYIALEGGMFEFEDENGNIFDLYGVEDVLSEDEYSDLVNSPGIQYNAKMFGWMNHFISTFHMHGTPVDVISLEVDF